jgi:ASC-1-like (ASCH) protein
VKKYLNVVKCGRTELEVLLYLYKERKDVVGDTEDYKLWCKECWHGRDK